jgi:restriction system protein
LHGHNNENTVSILQADFRTIMTSLADESVDLILTDPPYTDQVPHLERHQLYYPWLNINLDHDILANEIIITNAPSRPDKNSRDQYFASISEFFQLASRVLKTHKYLVIYFHPAKIHWTQDLNYFKLIARINGFEPIQTVDISRNDPTVRKQASSAWEINDEIVLIYLKVGENERYWFDGDYWVDKTIYRAAVDTAQEVQGSFSYQAFLSNYNNYLRRDGKLGLTHQQYTPKIQEYLERYADFRNGLYTLKRGSPFDYLIGRLPFIQRIRDFTPLVIEELLSNQDNFTYPDFLLRLNQYLDNGEKEMIAQLQRDERLIETTLNQYVIESDNGTLIRRPELDIEYLSTDLRRVNLFSVDPYEFERLVQELLTRMNYSEVQVVGRSGDRGIDVIARDPEGFLNLVQVKRWRYRVPATPIQRIHSASLTRGANKSWVITTSQFTPDAIDEATNYTHTKLTNGIELMQLLEAIFPGRFRLSDD